MASDDEEEVIPPPRFRGSQAAACALLALLCTADGPLRTVRPHIDAPLVVAATDLHLLREGDLVFREGTEWVSSLVQAAQAGHGWSHVGSLLRQHGRWVVLHAVPAEKPGRIDGVVLDPLEFFMGNRLAKRVGFYRVDASDSQRQVAIGAALARLGQPFRLHTINGGTYCTELIQHAYRDAGVHIPAQSTYLHLPMLPGDYLLPKALSASPALRLVALSKD